MRRVLVAGMLGAILFLPVRTLAAVGEEQWDRCAKPNDEDAIGACSAIIEDPTQSVADRTDAYIWRANHHMEKDHYQLAIADYGRALKLAPSNMTALVSRAVASYRNNDKAAAILDYSMAARLSASELNAIQASNPDVAAIADLEKASPASGEAVTAALAALSTVECGPGFENRSGECRRIAADRYGAIAIATTRRIFLSAVANYSSLEDATENVMARCRKNAGSARSRCRVVHTVVNGCLAFFWTPTGTGWGAARRPTQTEAEYAALTACQEANRSRQCRKAYSGCSNRVQ